MTSQVRAGKFPPEIVNCHRMHRQRLTGKHEASFTRTPGSHGSDFTLCSLCSATDCAAFVFAAILGVHTLVTSSQTYDGTPAKEGFNSKAS